MDRKLEKLWIDVQKSVQISIQLKIFKTFIIILSESFLSHQMLDHQYLSCMEIFRSLERNLQFFSSVNIQYLDAYSTIIDGILEICDVQGLKKSTKFLVKKSIDTYALSFPLSSPEELSKAAVGFLMMGVKINEDPILYEKMTIKWYLDNFQNESNLFTMEELVNFELTIYHLPQFNLNLTTPYDYLGLYRQIFLFDEKLIIKLNNILDLCYTIPQLMLKTAEEIFVGGLLFTWQEKRKEEKQWLLNLSLNKENSIQVAQIISNCYNMELSLAERQISLL